MLTYVDKGLRFLADFSVFGNLSTFASTWTNYLERRSHVQSAIDS